MIKVLQVHGQMAYGGAEKRTVELMPLLTEKGVHFDYCTFVEEEKPLDAKILEYGGNIYTCCLRPDVWSFGKRFIRFLRESDYDIVHTYSHYFSGYLVHLARKAGIESRIVHFRNTSDGRALTFRRKLYHKIMRKLVDKHATAILAVSRAAMEFAWGQDWKKDSRCSVIHNGLDLSGYERTGNERQDVLKEFGIGGDSKLIINVASFTSQKAHDVLLDAAAEVISRDKKAHFILVGDGVLRSEMENKAAQLLIEHNVHFTGVRDDVPRLLMASDCFVLASRWEGLPGVVLESLAAQLPVVATDLPGVREIAEHTDLIRTVPLNHSRALGEEILEVIKKGKPRATKPFPSEFSLSRCADKLYDVYKSQIGQYGK